MYDNDVQTFETCRYGTPHKFFSNLPYSQRLLRICQFFNFRMVREMREGLQCMDPAEVAVWSEQEPKSIRILRFSVPGRLKVIFVRVKIRSPSMTSDHVVF